MKLLKSLLFFSLFPCSASAFAEQEIEFEISVPVQSFTNNISLTVNLWSEAQLKIREQNSSCSVSYDVATQKESLDCPEGVKFQETAQEKFSIPLQEKIIFTSKTIKQGDKFEVTILGRSSDKCNTVSARISDQVKNSKVVFNNVSWMSTEMGCSLK